MIQISLTQKIVGIISIAILLIGTIIILLFVSKEAIKIEQRTKDKIQLLGELEVAKVSSDFHLLIDKARNQAVYFKNLIETNQTDRESANNLIRKIVESDTMLYSASVVFEHDKFDGKDDRYRNTSLYGKKGLFTSWWYRKNNKLYFEPLLTFQKEEWYAKISKTGSSLLEPYPYQLENGEMQLFISAVYPIIIDDENIGATYSDMSLEYIQNTIASINMYEGDYSSLISPSGIYAAHPIKEKVGTNMDFQDLKININEIFDKKESIYYKHFSDYIQEEVYDFYVPVKIRYIDKEWCLRISVPTKIVDKQVARYRNNLMFLLIGKILTILIINYLVLYYSLRPVTKISRLITKLSHLGVEGASPVKVNTNDEIGKLSKSYNKLIESLVEKKKVEDELYKHQTQLEFLVQERTEELSTANEELNAINEEVYDANNKLSKQKNEIEQTLIKLQETQTQLVQSEKMASVGVLTAGIAHEINNPVNYINSSTYGLKNFITGFNKMYALMLEVSKEASKDSQKKIAELHEEIDFGFIHKEVTSVIDIILSGTERIAGIVKGLRAFSHQDNTKKQLIDINENLDITLSLLQHEIKRGIEVTKNYGRIPKVLCFAGKINQVFMNLLVNSIHAIEDKGKITIETKVHDNEKDVIIKIKDNGNGISETNINKIFEPFFTTKKVGEGTGLGLYISYNIIKEHNGNIKVESIPNKRTEFTINLPLV